MRTRVVGTLVLALAWAGCGGDTKKITSTCASDDECAGGVCYESACYTACPDSADPCAGDQACVLRARAGGDVAICVAAAVIACTSTDDCAEEHPKPCTHAKCDPDTGRCVMAELFEGEACTGWVDRAAPAGSGAASASVPEVERLAADGLCFHGVCRPPCATDAQCGDQVCALHWLAAGDDWSYCVPEALAPCRAEGFGEEFADACSSIWRRTGDVCSFAVSWLGPSAASIGCDAEDAVCLSEGCSTECVSDADCGGGTCTAFYTFAPDPTNPDSEYGFFKACR